MKGQVRESARVWAALYCIGLILVLAAADGLEARHPFFKKEFWAVFDNMVHALVGGAVVFPAIWTRRWPVWTLILGMVSGSLIDLDHFVAAGSVSISDAVAIGQRPFTHSLLVSLLIAATAGLVSRDKRAASAVGAALACHVVRDASGSGAPLLWPLAGIQHLPVWAYLGITGLVACSFFGRKAGP